MRDSDPSMKGGLVGPMLQYMFHTLPLVCLFFWKCLSFSVCLTCSSLNLGCSINFDTAWIYSKTAEPNQWKETLLFCPFIVFNLLTNLFNFLTYLKSLYNPDELYKVCMKSVIFVTFFLLFPIVKVTPGVSSLCIYYVTVYLIGLGDGEGEGEGYCHFVI